MVSDVSRIPRVPITAEQFEAGDALKISTDAIPRCCHFTPFHNRDDNIERVPVTQGAESCVSVIIIPLARDPVSKQRTGAELETND